ncbi:MAG TPA: M14 family zinc carboxypeptidase [Gaiellaceae bacterium]|nr:M14 family zinc carboxypeptidase [Gaiellaceae bacterium]
MTDRLGSDLLGWRVEEYGRSRNGVPLRVFLPEGDGPSTGLLTAAQHGEEADTALLARRLLERVSGAETKWAVIPVLNPDGLLAGTRQNAAGVDLNRNFPASTWEPGVTFTFPPGIDPELRVVANRTNRSSTGTHAGSEPETKALTALLERLQPPVVVDLHSPLELIYFRGDVRPELIAALADSAQMPAQDEMEGHCPGAFDDWLTERGTAAVVYEIEHAGLPGLCKRHLPGLEGLLRT